MQLGWWWGGPFGFSSTSLFRGMFRSSDHCLVLPGANRRENIMRGQPRPLVRRFETLHALPIRLQIRNAKYMRDRTDNCTQPSNGKPRKYLGRRSDVRSRRKLHPLEAFALPYHLSHARVRIDTGAERQTRSMLAIFRTYLVCAEISRCQLIRPEFTQLLIAWALERVLSPE